MKALLLFSLIAIVNCFSIAQVIVNPSALNRKYIDLTNSQSIVNSENKPLWELKFQDEFNVNQVRFVYNTPDYTNDYFKALNTKWKCRWDAYSRLMDPFYDRVENIDTTNTGFVRLQVKNEVYQPSNHNMYPVEKNYTAAEILTGEIRNGSQILKSGHFFKYGYFEARCKLPTAKYAWPAFWLFTGSGGHSSYNEIDVIELGGNDAIVHTNHWRPVSNSSGSVTSWGDFTYAYPGQKFGGQWVTYAVKWEPNKIVWYINNKPVRIVRDIDQRVETNTGQLQNVIIPNTPMYVIADNVLNMEWMRYNAINAPEYPNNMDIDYIRVYQRTDTASSYINTPEPVFTLNGIPCGGSDSLSIKAMYSSKLTLDASESYMPNHLYNIIIKAQNNSVIANVTLQDGNVNISNIDLHTLCPLVNGGIYKVIVRGTSNGITREKSQMVQLASDPGFQPTFKLNGLISSAYTQPVVMSYNNGKSAIVLDVTDALANYSCNRIKVEFWDGLTNLASYPYIEILLTSNIIDLEKTLRDNNFYYDTYNTLGGIYFVSLPEWPDAPRISFGISSCSTQLDFTLNTLSSGYLKSLSGTTSVDFSVLPGDDIILSASGSKLCDNNYTVTVRNVTSPSLQCSVSLKYIQDDGNYIEWYSPAPTVPSEHYSIGNFDIRKFCRQNNFPLTQEQNYVVILQSGSTSVQKTFNIDNTLSAYSSNFQFYHFLWCADPSAYTFLSNEDITLYSSNSMSQSVDRSYSVIVEDIIQSTPADTFELSGDQIYRMKILGSLSFREKACPNKLLCQPTELKTFIPVSNGQLVPSKYRITLRNYTKQTKTAFSQTLHPEYFSQSQQILTIYPADRIINIADMTINADKTINTGEKVILSSSLKVKQGKTLTIKGDLQFNKDCKLIVEIGAKLIIDGGKISSNQFDFINDACSWWPDNVKPQVTWKGIEIWGNYLSRQLQVNQGYIKIRTNGANRGTIENAEIAILAANSAYASATGGGILDIDGASFINNKYSVYMLFYHNHNYNGNLINNISKIRNSIFSIDNTLSNPVNFVFLYDVEGVEIGGNNFSYNNPSNLNETKGTGIECSNASCFITENSSGIGNTFSKLNYGINVHNSNSLKSVTIRNNTFQKNLHGIDIRNSNNSYIATNNFLILSPNIQPDYYGVYIENCTGYKFEDNTFHSYDLKAKGTIVKNWSNNTDYIYRNKYYHLHIGTQVQSSLITSGIQVKCNEYYGLIKQADIAFTSGKVAEQGSCNNADHSYSAGNYFHSTGHLTATFKSIFSNYPNNSCNSIIYNTQSDRVPTSWSNGITVNPCSYTYNSSDCPPTLSGSGSSPIALIASISTFNSQLSTFNSKIDGGNSQNLLNKVNSNLAAGKLKDVLLNSGKYLSDTVLVAAIKKTNPLPPGILKDIIEPNSPVTAKVMNAIVSAHLPNGIMQNIQNFQTGTSGRFILEQQITTIQQQKDLTTSELMRYYSNDTLIKIDSTILFLKTQTDVNSKMQLAQAYLLNGDCAYATAILNNLPQQTQEEITYKQFYSIMASLCSQGKTLFDISPSQMQIINTISTSNTSTSTAAKSVLTTVNGTFFPEIIDDLIFPDNQTISGYLHNNSTCNNNPVINDTIVILDSAKQVIKLPAPVITDQQGFFKFNYNHLMLLNETVKYTFGTASGAVIQDTIFKTIQQWITASPVNLNLKKLTADFVNDTVQCFDDTVHFTNKTMFSKKPYTYSWSFAFHSGSALANPVHKYSSAGIYNTSLIATDALGCKDTTIKQIIIPACPSIFGTIVESVECGSMPIINDTIFITDYFDNIYDTIFATVNNTGQFAFDESLINKLDTNFNYGFKLKSGFGFEQLQYNSIRNWKTMSPLSLITDHREYWSRDFSMSDSAKCFSTSIDINRNIYVAGTAYYPNLKTDYMLIKYNPVGDELWHISYNPFGFGNYSLTDMKNDNSGNCILTGSGDEGSTTVKINPDGIIEWSNIWTDDNYFGEDGYLAIDSLNNIYLASNISDGSGVNNFALTKFAISGQKLWSIIYNSNSLHLQKNIIDKAGNIILLCLNQNTNSSYIFKYNSSGTLIWSAYNTNSLLNLTVGNDNSVYATGNTVSTPVDFFTVKYDVNGNYKWSQTYSYSLLSGNNIANQITIDKDGNIIVAGISPYFAVNGPNNTIIHKNSYSLVKYAPDGTQLWDAIFAIEHRLYSSWDYIASIITDKLGNIYTAGSEKIYPYIPRVGFGKPYSQFLTTKFNSNGDIVWNESPYTTKYNSSYLSDLIVSDNENVYVTGTTFLNGVRTIKYVQCPLQANNARYGNSANNSSGTNETISNEQQTVTLSKIEGLNEYVNMFPNPNDGNFYFNYSLPENEICRFAVLDQLGKKVYDIDIKSGRNTIFINSNDFSNGVYYYQVTAGNRLIKTERLVIVK